MTVFEARKKVATPGAGWLELRRFNHVLYRFSPKLNAASVRLVMHIAALDGRVTFISTLPISPDNRGLNTSNRTQYVSWNYRFIGISLTRILFFFRFVTLSSRNVDSSNRKPHSPSSFRF